MAALHGMLNEIGKGENVALDDDEWKLPESKRQELLDTFDRNEPDAVEEDAPPEKSKVVKLNWVKIGVAVALIAFLAGGLMFPGVQGPAFKEATRVGEK